MKKIVVDSSVIAKWLSKANEERTELADEILNEVREDNVELLAPDLAKYEVGNVIIKKQLNISEGLKSLATLYSLPITYVSLSEQLASETYKTAYKHEVTFYDATFIALAKEQKAELITDNPKHQKKDISGVKITPLKDYK